MSNIIVDPHQQYEEVEKHVLSNPSKTIATFSPILNSQFTGSGIEMANVVLIGARYGVGKTYFILNWILDLIKQKKYRVLFFSLDMDFQKVFIRLLRLVLNAGKLETIDKWKADKESVKEKLIEVGYFDWLRIYTNESHRISFGEISTIVEKEKPDIVFIDHFSKVFGDGSNLYKESRVTAEYFRKNKKSMGTIFVILMQLRKNDHARTKTPNLFVPGSSEIKGAGEICEDADVILALTRPDIDPDCTNDRKKMIVGALRKNRLNDDPDMDFLFWDYDPVTTKVQDSRLNKQ